MYPLGLPYPVTANGFLPVHLFFLYFHSDITMFSVMYILAL